MSNQTQAQQAEAAKAARRDQHTKETKRLFIEAARRLIQENGVSAFTVRKLSAEVGLGGATLYSYFANLDELMAYVTVQYHGNYRKQLYASLRSDMSVLEQYLMTCRIFNHCAASAPSLFLEMYFGEHSPHIEAIFKDYYKLYPEEILQAPAFLQDILGENDLFRFDRAFLQKISDEGFLLPAYVDITSELILCLQQSYLYELTHKPHTNLALHEEKFQELIRHIMQRNGPT